MFYTRKGDDGKSSLFGSSNRVSKDDVRFEALGDLDELNSILGVCRALIEDDNNVMALTKDVQECLFIAQAEVAGSEKSLSSKHIKRLEESIEKIEVKIKLPKAFVITGETKLSALFDYARAMSRRTERSVVKVSKVVNICKETLMYLNRLSSFLYIVARYFASRDGAKEDSPTYE